MTEPRPSIRSTRKLRMGPDSDRADREYWLAMTPDERVAETWRLTVEQWEMKGWNPDEPGLCRSVARVIRR
jgi:hypothetical protein